ncbi:MAG: glycosyltransferase family 2 protein [Syntrophomonadaceae bacterium]|nr:glycosyltransferase family 2 protein [Syntrophomonadaceae bacterium]
MVTIIIPAFNEEDTIACTIRSLFKIPEINKVLVVDDGSTDRTAELAEETGASVIRLEKNSGKGEALTAAGPFVTSEVVGLIDADLGNSAELLRPLILPVLNGEADLVIAKFLSAKPKAGFGIVKNVASLGLKLLAGIDSSAPLSGQRIMKHQVWRDSLPLNKGFGVEVGQTLKAARKGYRIMEIELPLSHRFTSNDISGFLHRGKQLWHVLRAFFCFCFLREGHN